MASPLLYILGSVILVSALSLCGTLLFWISEDRIRGLLMYFVSFSAGVMLGDVFLHIIPEMAESVFPFEQSVLIVLGGILVSFSIEKFIHWHHCHVFPSREHYHPVGTMSLVADGIHNFVDGMLIAGSFLISIPLGITTTVAVVLHEIPQEISDFALLLYSGFSRQKALLFNFLSGFVALAGALIVIALAGKIEELEAFLLAFTAGNFLYIAGTDLLPELHKDTRASRAAAQLLLIILGIGVMYGLTMIE